MFSNKETFFSECIWFPQTHLEKKTSALQYIIIIFLPLSYVVGELLSGLVLELLFGLASDMTCDLAWGSLNGGQDLLLSLSMLCSQSSDPVGLCPVAWRACGSGVTLGFLLTLTA